VWKGGEMGRLRSHRGVGSRESGVGSREWHVGRVRREETTEGELCFGKEMR